MLMVACSNGYLEIVKYLIENEICPFREIYAVNSVRKLIITYLFINIYSVCKQYQWNVLMLTCQKGDLDIVKYLIENNICPFREIYSTNYVIVLIPFSISIIISIYHLSLSFILDIIGRC